MAIRGAALRRSDFRPLGRFQDAEALRLELRRREPYEHLLVAPRVPIMDVIPWKSRDRVV